jgi:hypothetical protein
MLPVSRLYSVDIRMINEYGAVGVMPIGKGNEVLEGNLPQCLFFRHKYVSNLGLRGRKLPTNHLIND